MVRVADSTGEIIAQPQRLVAVISGHQEIAPAHYKMRLQVGAMAQTGRAGQFVHMLSRSTPIQDPLLRRAFSIMALSHDSIEVLYRVMGRGTAELSRLRAGDVVDLIGPLGRPFAPLPQRALLVGGGVGVPPLVMLASTRQGDNSITAVIGARSQQELIGMSELEAMGVPVEVTTDDGSLGHHGRVTDLLETHLQSAAPGQRPTVFSCGPFAMLKAVAELCRKYNAPCQVSLEENMPCGVGICNGCVIPVVGAGDDYGRYRRICIEGPIVWAHEIDWEHLSASAACY